MYKRQGKYDLIVGDFCGLENYAPATFKSGSFLLLKYFFDIDGESLGHDELAITGVHMDFIIDRCYAGVSGTGDRSFEQYATTAWCDMMRKFEMPMRTRLADGIFVEAWTKLADTDNGTGAFALTSMHHMLMDKDGAIALMYQHCLLYTSPSPRD